MSASCHTNNGINGNGTYTHKTRGRLRHDVGGLRNSLGFVRKVESEFSNIEGVLNIEANALTGRVLVLFEPERLTHDELIKNLDSFKPVIDKKKDRRLRKSRKKRVAKHDCRGNVSKAGNKTEEMDVESGLSIKGQIIKLCTTGAILFFLFVKRRFLGPTRLANSGALLGLSGITTVVVGYPVFRNGLAVLAGKDKVNIDTLITVATIATFVLRESLTGLVVVWLIDLSNLLKTLTLRRSRKAFEELLSLDEEIAWIVVDEVEVKMPVEDIKVDDVVVTHIGEKIVVDGEVVKGEAAVNQAAITGESNLVTKQSGDRVFAGTFVEMGTLYIKAKRVGDETQLARIVQIVEEAQEGRADIQNVADRFAQRVIPISFILSALTFIFTRDIRRSLTMLVIACPCAVGLSTPTAVVAAIGGAARRGILIKGGANLETAGNIDSVIFDKTGTLTVGEPRVTRVISLASRYNPEEVLLSAAIGVKHSSHPLASAVLVHVNKTEAIIPEHTECEVVIGHGVRAISDGIQILVGSRHFMDDMEIEVNHESSEQSKRLVQSGESVLYIAREDTLIGIIGVKDVLRPSIDQTIADLRENGVNKIYVVTGDHYESASVMARGLDIDEIKASMLPEDKSDFVKELQNAGNRVAMVGDGINDGPALAVADLGIAMKTNGTDVAIEAADVAITGDRLQSVSETIQISKQAMKMIHQNFTFSIGINSLGILLGMFGVISPLTAAILHNANTLGVVFNSSRLYLTKVGKDTNVS
ncbi:MAG: cation-translocating P-type ATPase [Candidatus Brocadiales bacterium]|nr:cation-translocating P-type ATPase [Candidatus Brocadiales bacterium]